MRKIRKNREKADLFGNVTFGEATELLVDIIGQIVILDFIPEGDHLGYKRKLERMYDGKGPYSDFATAAPKSPQNYFFRFFKEILEEKYNVSPLVMVFIDSFTWQFFYALRNNAFFERPKKHIALFLIKKQIFNYIYHNLIKGTLIDGKLYRVSSNLILDVLTDNYELIFSDIEDAFKKDKLIFIDELRQYWNDNCKSDPEKLKTMLINELLNDDDVFYNEIIESYKELISEKFKINKPKLYNLLLINKEDKTFIQTFQEAIEEYLDNDIDTFLAIIEEIPKYKIKYPHSLAYINIGKFNFDDNIDDWRKNVVYNPTWKTLKIILEFLEKNNKLSFARRLIGLYLFKNTQRSLEINLGISENIDQEKIIIDITTMINENKKPEDFYDEDNSDLIDYANLIFMCQTYQHLPYWNKNIYCIETLNNIIKLIKNRCINSSVFFSPWLKARSLLFNKIESLSDNEKKDIVDNYKKAYDYGLAYAGEYLCQFLLEAIIINKYFYPTQVKNINDLFGYSDALEIFGDDKKWLLEKAKKTDNLLKEIVSVHYCIRSPMGKMFDDYCPQLQEVHSIIEINYEAEKLHNKGLGYKKIGNLEEAVINYSAAIILCPISAETYFNRGLAYAELGKQYYGNAINDFSLTILLNPNDCEAYFNRGNIYAYTGNKEKASEDFQKAMEIDPNYTQTSCKEVIELVI